MDGEVGMKHIFYKSAMMRPAGYEDSMITGSKNGNKQSCKLIDTDEITACLIFKITY